MRFRKIVVERVTFVKFRVDNRGSDGTGCFRIEVRTDTAELSDMRIAGLRKNLKNRPTFATVTVKIKVAQFFGLTVYE